MSRYTPNLLMVVFGTVTMLAVIAGSSGCKVHVGVSGPTAVPVGGTTTLTADGDPDGGTYSWAVTAGGGSVTGTGESATFTAPSEVSMSTVQVI